MVDLIQGLERYGMDVEVVDPWVDTAQAQHEYGLKVSNVMPLIVIMVQWLQL